MPDKDQNWDRLSCEYLFRTFEEERRDDDDLAAGTRVPTPQRPNRDDAVIALPEPIEDGDDS